MSGEDVRAEEQRADVGTSVKRFEKAPRTFFSSITPTKAEVYFEPFRFIPLFLKFLRIQQPDRPMRQCRAA